MERKKNIRRGFLIPLIVVASLVTSFVFATDASAANKSITYNANGGTGTVPTGGNYAVNSNYIVLGNIGVPPLSKTGYVFAGWNTLANGTGTTYQPGSNYVVPNANTIFYARWRISVTYDSNGGTSGTAPVDSSSPYALNATVTVLGNSGSLARVNFAFANWNTAADGTGSSYSGGNTFSAAANLTLYAQWTPTYTVVYTANGATEGSVPIDSASPYSTGSNVTVLGNTGSLARIGNSFAGWNTVADGSGTAYIPTNTFAISTNIILYAQWTATVTYDSNGASGGTVPSDGSSPYLNGSTVTVLGNSGTLTKTNYAFAGWNTVANGTGTAYSSGNTFAIDANTVLYAQWAINTHTVTYNGNTNDGGTAPVDGSSPYSVGSTVTVLGNTGSLTKNAFLFSHWNTAANGAGTSYSPGATFSIGANTVLYAQWATSYTVTYNGNGKTSGSSPTLDPVTYSAGATVTVLGNIGSLARTGNTFSNWNTAANGSGTQYAAGDTFPINANVILYAQWRANVTYDANGANGGTVPTDGSSPYLNGSTVTVLGNSGLLTRTGYVFTNWNTAANGLGTSYSGGDSFVISAHTTLYAQWVTAHTVTYDGNTFTGGAVPVDSSSPYQSGATVAVLGNTGSLVKTGSSFSHWNTLANGTGTSYTPGNNFVIGANITLFAQWGSVGSYTVTYFGNGSTGGSVPVDGSSPYAGGSSVTVLDNTGTLIKSGFTFSGWNTASNGSGTSYSPSNTLLIGADTFLYAQWAGITYTVTYNANGSNSGTVPIDAASPYINGATVTVSTNSGSLGKIGYVFSGWNTVANGTGIAYATSATFTIAANTTLYAQWTPIYTLIYRPAGSTGGSVPVDGLSPYTSGWTVTVLGNTGTLVRTGTTFDNWNTAIDGTGNQYSLGSTFTIGADTLLYAQWRSSITYDGNGATGGSVPVDGLSPYLTPYINSPTITVLGNTGSLVKLSIGGVDYHTFVGWNTAADGTGTSYIPGNTFVLTASTVLYAQWAPITYTVTYNSNAATSGTVPVDASSPYLDGSSVTVKVNTGLLAKTGYIFVSWNTAGDGTGTSYSPTNTFTIHANTILYPQWTRTFTLSYDEDGAIGGTPPLDPSSPYASGTTVTVLGNSGSLVRTGNTFGGWNTAENGTGTQYAPASMFSILANTILFAQWTVTVTYDGDGATGGSVPVDASSPYPNPYGAQPLITVLGNPGSLVRSGYTFAHWGTGPNNGGEHFLPGDHFLITQNTILYAHWEVIGMHNVVYNDNGSTGGSIPVDASNPHAAGTTVTVLGNTGALVKSGSFFTGWNTSADGSGITYQPSDQFVINAATVLYARWASDLYTVSYDGNGSTGGTAPIDANNPYDGGDSVTILTNSGALVRAGYTFAGWNTAGDGSGTTFDASGGATFVIAEDTTFYALWLQNHTVVFDPNTATAGSMSTQTSGSANSLTTNSFAKSGYSFNGWNTSPDGSGLLYADGATYAFGSDLILYAQWILQIQPSSQPVPTSPVAPVATLSSPVSETVDSDEATESVIEATLELLGGEWAEVSVTVPAGASSSNITLSISPATSTDSLGNSQLTIKVTATDSSGAAVTHFDKPLSINMGHVAATSNPMFSEDGITWTAVPLLSGTVLPDSMQEGYYVASDGHTVILTRHLTYFGIRKSQRNLTATPRTISIEVGRSTRVVPTGGSGIGLRSFITSTPDICKISSGGLLTGLSSGICTFQTTKAGDHIYIASESPVNHVHIEKTSQRKLWITSTATAIVVGQKSAISVHGGSGTGVLTFRTSDTTVCSISSQGIITALKVGECKLWVVRAGDGRYLSAASSSLTITVTRK